MIIRVAAPLADDLRKAQLAEPVPSETRSATSELVVNASIVAKDVASVILAVAAGARGVRAILDWLRRHDDSGEVVIKIHSPGAERSWSLQPGQLDEATVEEISHALDNLAVEEAGDAVDVHPGDYDQPR